MGLSDWEAMIAAYTVLYLVAESPTAAPIAHALAWGIVGTYVIWAATHGNGLRFSELTPASGPGAASGPRG